MAAGVTSGVKLDSASPPHGVEDAAQPSPVGKTDGVAKSALEGTAPASPAAPLAGVAAVAATPPTSGAEGVLGTGGSSGAAAVAQGVLGTQTASAVEGGQAATFAAAVEPGRTHTPPPLSVEDQAACAAAAATASGEAAALAAIASATAPGTETPEATRPAGDKHSVKTLRRTFSPFEALKQALERLEGVVQESQIKEEVLPLWSEAQEEKSAQGKTVPSPLFGVDYLDHAMVDLTGKAGVVKALEAFYDARLALVRAAKELVVAQAQLDVSPDAPLNQYANATKQAEFEAAKNTYAATFEALKSLPKASTALDTKATDSSSQPKQLPEAEKSKAGSDALKKEMGWMRWIASRISSAFWSVIEWFKKLIFG